MKSDHEIVQWLSTRKAPFGIWPPCVEGGTEWTVEVYRKHGSLFHRGNGLREALSCAIEHEEDER